MTISFGLTPKIGLGKVHQRKVHQGAPSICNIISLVMAEVVRCDINQLLTKYGVKYPSKGLTLCYCSLITSKGNIWFSWLLYSTILASKSLTICLEWSRRPAAGLSETFHLKTTTVTKKVCNQRHWTVMLRAIIQNQWTGRCSKAQNSWGHTNILI